MSAPDEPITMLSYKTGSPSFREGEVTLTVELDGTVHLLHRAFLHAREWTARLELGVWAELIATFRASRIQSVASGSRTGVPGTIVSRATWKIGDKTETSVIGDTRAEIDFQRLAEQSASQVAPGVLELGSRPPNRALVLASKEMNGTR